MSQFTYVHGTGQTPIGLYIHIPFCARKCPYCDFNTYAGLGPLHARTVDALCSELADWGSRLSDKDVTSVFVGGGTPTALSHAQLAQLFERICAELTLADDCEISVEANPGTVDRDKFSHLRELGVNRLSMGVQSFQPAELAFLGRIHDVDDVYAAYESARMAGFDNVNLDFIFGLPNQDIGGWKETLNRAIALGPEHLSLYSLIVEPETPLFAWVEEGKVEEPDDDVTALLYEVAVDLLGAAGYNHYEVSNWAIADEAVVDPSEMSHETEASTIPRLACRHNLLYWRNEQYVGIGPGAHSHLRQCDGAGATYSRRWSNVRAVDDYVRRVDAGISVEDFSEEIDARTSMGETMMLGLRLVNEGVSYQRFEQLHGADLRHVFGRELMQLQGQGLLISDDDDVRLTRRGLMIGNQAFAAFLSDEAGAVAA